MAVNVEAVINAAETRANEVANAADAALTSALGLMSVVIPGGTPTITAPAAVVLPSLPNAPVLTNVTMPSLPSLGSRPSVQSVSLGGLPTLPTAPSGNVAITAPTRPGNTPSFGKSAPTLASAPSLPSAPAAFAGAMPSIGAVTMPTAPVLNRPGFTGVKPADPSAAPDVSNVLEQQYRTASPLMIRTLEGEVDAFLAKINPEYSTQLSRLERKIEEFASGATETGFTPAVEDAIYARSTAKQTAETQRVQAEALTVAARRGFTLPTGALMSAMQQARQAGADNNAAAACEIVVMQAEMQQKNMQFALSLSADLRKATVSAGLSYHQSLVSLNGQAIQFAQGVVDALVKTYDLAVQTFRAKLDGYKADAEVFQTLTQASLAEVELYKARIDGEKAKVDVDQARVQAYKVQVEAHQAAVETYGKNVQAIVSLAQLERVKIDAFQAEVQAFAAQVQASGQEWQAYSAAWNGEESKVKAYLAQAQVYAAQVDGYRAAIAAKTAEVQAISASNQSNLGAFQAEVQAFGAQAQANASVVGAQINAQDSLVKAYQVTSQAAIAAASAAAEKYRAESQVAIENGRLKSTAVIEEAKVLVASTQGAANVALGVGQAYAGMAQAALSGVTTLVKSEGS